jgi:hypothetical protein
LTMLYRFDREEDPGKPAGIDSAGKSGKIFM